MLNSIDPLANTLVSPAGKPAPVGYVVAAAISVVAGMALVALVSSCQGSPDAPGCRDSLTQASGACQPGQRLVIEDTVPVCRCPAPAVSVRLGKVAETPTGTLYGI